MSFSTCLARPFVAGSSHFVRVGKRLTDIHENSATLYPGTGAAGVRSTLGLDPGGCERGPCLGPIHRASAVWPDHRYLGECARWNSDGVMVRRHGACRYVGGV